MDGGDGPMPARPLDAALYEPVSSDAPTGKPLKREDVAPLRELCEGREGTYIDAENPNVGGAPPDHRSARSLALELLERSRDMRVLVRLAQAEASVGGAQGLHAALHLLDHWLRKEWENLHPGPPDDRLAKRERAQAFAPLTSPSIAAAVEKARVFKGAGLDGEVTLRDFLFAAGKRQPGPGEIARPPEGLAEVIARAKAEPAVAETAEALGFCASLLRGLEGFLKTQEDFPAPRTDRLAQALDGLSAAARPFVAAPSGEAAADQTAAPEAGATESAPARASAPVGAIASRDAALALLDDVIGYYAREARSSPLPLVLIKLRDMHDRPYRDWVALLASEGPDSAALPVHDVEPDRLDEFAGTEDGDGGGSADWRAHLAAARAAVAALRERGGDAPQDGAEEASDDGGNAVRDEVEAGEVAEAEADGAGVSGSDDSFAELERSLEALAAAIEQAPPGPPRRAGKIRDRAGVKAALTQAAAYFAAAEPANPVSICLTRANALVEMSFMATIAELAPEGGDTLSLRIAPKPESE